MKFFDKLLSIPYINMEYGSPFKKPPISSTAFPGSWILLHNKSHFILSVIEVTLNHMKTLNYQLSPKLEIELFTAGAQIVSGINIYVEFRIINPLSSLDVQVLVYEPALNNDRKPSIEQLYITSQKIFRIK